MKNAQKLTLKEAREQGYMLWFYSDPEWQPANKLSEITDADFTGGVIELCEIQTKYPTCDCAEDLIELIAENIASNHGNDTGNDTDDVYDAIKSVDPELLQPFIDTVNEKLRKHPYYMGSGIQLIP